MKASTRREYRADFEEVVRAAQEDGEDIRLATILGCGFIERYLPELLAQRLPGLEETERKPFFQRSLRGARQRVELARGLGVLKPYIADDILTLFDIRNWFAHHVRVVNADHPEVARLIDRLDVLDRIEERDGVVFRDRGRDFCLRAVIYAASQVIHGQLEVVD